MNAKKTLKKALTWTLATLALSSIYLSPAFAIGGRNNNWHMDRWMMGGWGMGWFGMIFMLFFWVLIIAGIVFLIRWLAQNTGSRNRADACAGSQAMDTLKVRFAKGEITRDEFESMKKDILQ